MLIRYIASVFTALRILSGIALIVDIIVFLCTTNIIFGDFEDEFNKKLLKIMIITGIVSLILLVFLPGRSILLGAE